MITTRVTDGLKLKASKPTKGTGKGLNCSARGGGSLFGGPLIILYSKPVKIFPFEVYRVAQKVNHH